MLLIFILIISILIRNTDTKLSKDFVGVDIFKNVKVSYSNPHILNNSIILTVANDYLFDLVVMQTSYLIEMNYKSLLEAYGIVCIDISSYSKCTRIYKYESINCIYGVHDDVKASDFNENDYKAATFLKWQSIKQALQKFDYVFMFDADVLLLKNPWFNTINSISEYEYRYQVETYEIGNKCNKAVNSGQIVLRKSNATLLMVDEIIASETLPYDDQYLSRVAAIHSNVSMCELPLLYAGHCWKKELEIPLVKLITYHTHCLIGMKPKLENMKLVKEKYIKAKKEKDKTIKLRDFLH